MLCIFLIFGCSVNRFKKSEQLFGFTFGLFGSANLDCEKKYDPNWLKPYANGIYPSRICTRYRHYTCHVTHYCPNLPTESERKKCEQDANDYWLKPWRDLKTGKLLDRVSATKEICESEYSKNNQSNK